MHEEQYTEEKHIPWANGTEGRATTQKQTQADVEAQRERHRIGRARLENNVIIEKGKMPTYKNNLAVAALRATPNAEAEALVLE